MLATSEEMADEFFASEKWLKTKKTGFAINRADSRQVFQENQMYVNTLHKGGAGAAASKALTRKLEHLQPKDYNLKDAESTRQELAPLLKEAETGDGDNLVAVANFLKGDDRPVNGKNTADTVTPNSELRKIADDEVKKALRIKSRTLTDVFGLECSVKAEALLNHTDVQTPSYRDEARHMLLRLVSEVITSPDEVSLQAKATDRINTYCYIKYYTSHIMVVKTQEYDGKWIIKTWYDLGAGSEPNNRQGLLIRRPQ